MLPCHYAVVFWWGTADVRLTFAAFLFFFGNRFISNKSEFARLICLYVCIGKMVGFRTNLSTKNSGKYIKTLL